MMEKLKSENYLEKKSNRNIEFFKNGDEFIIALK